MIMRTANAEVMEGRSSSKVFDLNLLIFGHDVDLVFSRTDELGLSRKSHHLLRSLLDFHLDVFLLILDFLEFRVGFDPLFLQLLFHLLHLLGLSSQHFFDFLEFLLEFFLFD